MIESEKFYIAMQLVQTMNTFHIILCSGNEKKSKREFCYLLWCRCGRGALKAMQFTK